MTIKQAIRSVKNKISSIYDESESLNIANWVVEYLTGYDRSMHAHAAMPEMNANQEKELEMVTQRLLNHEPVQYILNEAWFYEMRFYVNEHVLIPRPETEELVHWMLSDKSKQDAGILDIGTGSGCIPVTLKIKMPAAKISAVDVSAEAIEVAKKNAAEKKVDVGFMVMDFLDREAWNKLPRFDIIVSNPPYVKINEKNSMKANVVKYEPASALFVPDGDAFVFYRALAEFGEAHLEPHGMIYCEINENLGEETKKIFEDLGYTVEVRKDMQGKDRMIKAGKVAEKGGMII